MNCPNCKARNPIGNKFCRECGQKIPLEENPLAAEEAQQAEAERSRERAAELLQGGPVEDPGGGRAGPGRGPQPDAVPEDERQSIA